MLLRDCRFRGGKGTNRDAGVGGGKDLLILSQALGDVCLRVREVVAGGGWFVACV